ncbi:(2Fe-2S)-binding protein [Phenylobacterium sp.]|uniref:(2Fe-2S)-binding protein n=1 Tax=Phenylobacterium sp. TaxID=1871053 RepID=UPI001221C3AF|nr:(2Fe-2S)-binding protein [Phenylobacterium sp.]THD58123.1 MAG: (2Fe-2S)-binding protein [Phenylobacterium sp.]
MAMKLNVNGSVRDVDVEPDMPLLWVLRDELNIKGPKLGCGVGLCGACTVHIDGVARRSCMTPISTVGAAKITTIEGVGDSVIGKRLQKAWIDHDVAQCGYCQAGQIMSATALLQTHPKPTDAEIDGAMAGNICRCATYNRIRAAIKDAAGVAVA